MRQKLLNKKDYPKICETCVSAKPSPEGDTMLCIKNGIMQRDDCCRAYKYDPIKRVPKKAPVMGHYDKSEFEV